VHVGLNLIFLTPGESGGMETYARELLPALAARGDVRLTSFVNRAAAAAGGPWAEVGDQVLVDVDVANRIQWVRGEQQLLPGLARRAGVDVIHSLASTAPLWGRIPRVTTVHDLLYMKVPDAHFGVRGLGMRILVPASARRSRRVLVDAASTRDDLVDSLGLAPEKIDVAPLAAGSGGDAAPTPADRLRAQLDLGDAPLLLSVSAKRPHKNLPRLLRAWAALPDASRPVLVIPGYPTPHEQELWELARTLGVAGSLRMPGWLPAADLEGLYATASAFVFPSLYEGFGLPVLEAMRRGVPVACSDRSSLPEVAGDAALTFDPEREQQITGAILRLLEDPELAGRLREAGVAQAQRFSWPATAEATVAAYRRALA
jgi:glycosyltransferase involved in cell wall biosynthesis